MSYNNIGLVTPRGSGTSGYVQRNLSVLKNSSFLQNHPLMARKSGTLDIKPLAVKKPSKKILEHKRKRALELLCLNLKLQLEAEKASTTEIEAEIVALRKKRKNDSLEELEGRKKVETTHEILKAQNERNERLKRALKIKSRHREGDAFKFDEMRSRREDEKKRLTAEERLERKKHHVLERRPSGEKKEERKHKRRKKISK